MSGIVRKEIMQADGETCHSLILGSRSKLGTFVGIKNQGLQKFKGVRYTIIRGGKAVATLGPATTSAHHTILGELHELLTKGTSD